MDCVACRQQPTEVGVLCEDCRDDISAPLGMLAEQITATAATRTDAALIDQWGRPHLLDARAMIGRNVEGPGVTILEASISRHHAHLARAPGGDWMLRDLGAANGTFVNEQQVTEATPVRPGDRLCVGRVGFYFVLGAAELPEIPIDGEFEQERTAIGMQVVDMRLSEPTGGGGGVVEVGDQQVQLTATQLELFALLVRRMVEETTQGPQVRGFVRSSELIGRLSWDTREPSDNHVKQLVRRVRRALIKAHVGDLIESRHRFGYRLRAIPRLR